MYEGMAYDELNTLTDTRKSMPYSRYFGDTTLSKADVRERESMSEKLEDAFIFVLALIFTMLQYSDEVDWNLVQIQFRVQFRNVLNDIGVDIDDYLESYIDEFAQEVTDSTKDNIDDPYYLTPDRAKFMAENEAQGVGEYANFLKAKADGKTLKRWVDMRDNRERQTHLAIGGTVLPIDDLFLVGDDSLMRFPKDQAFSPSPEETVNCRCHCSYE